MWRGVTNPVHEAIRDASYVSQSIPVKGNILAYFLFFESISPLQSTFPFKYNVIKNPIFSLNIPFLWLIEIYSTL